MKQIDNLFLEKYNLWNIEKEIDYSIWITQQGDQIEVRKMNIQDLNNTINMLYRNNPKSLWIKYLEKELTKRNYYEKI